MFINYRKTYDSVPHLWVPGIFVCISLGSFFYMTSWKTDMHVDCTVLGSLDMKCRIFHSDALISILFVISMLPLTLLLRKESTRYMARESIIYCIWMISSYMLVRSLLYFIVLVLSLMSFGASKHAKVLVHKGKLKDSAMVCLPDGQPSRSLGPISI